MNLGPIDDEPKDEQPKPGTDVKSIPVCLPSKFLDTSMRMKLDLPTGSIAYLDMVEDRRLKGDNQLKLEAKIKFFETSDKNMKLELASAEQSDELAKNFGIDVESMLLSAVANEIKEGISSELYNKYKKHGDRSRKNFWSKFRTTLHERIGLDFFPVIGKSFSQRKLHSKIMMASNLIAQSSRRGQAEFMVVNHKIASMLQDLPPFVFDSSAQGMEEGIIKPIGQISNIKIFLNQNEKEDVIVLGRNGNKNDPAVFLGELSNEVTIKRPKSKTATPSAKIVSRYVISTVGDNAYKNYYTLRIKFWNELSLAEKIKSKLFKTHF